MQRERTGAHNTPQCIWYDTGHCRCYCTLKAAVRLPGVHPQRHFTQDSHKQNVFTGQHPRPVLCLLFAMLAPLVHLLDLLLLSLLLLLLQALQHGDAPAIEPVEQRQQIKEVNKREQLQTFKQGMVVADDFPPIILNTYHVSKYCCIVQLSKMYLTLGRDDLHEINGHLCALAFTFWISNRHYTALLLDDLELKKRQQQHLVRTNLNNQKAAITFYIPKVKEALDSKEGECTSWKELKLQAHSAQESAKYGSLEDLNRAMRELDEMEDTARTNDVALNNLKTQLQGLLSGDMGRLTAIRDPHNRPNDAVIVIDEDDGPTMHTIKLHRTESGALPANQGSAHDFRRRYRRVCKSMPAMGRLSGLVQRIAQAS
ncbi:hypothetical protein Pelo_1296 [Pelomyxa schiedti]|nr:hypothetical protein Pelo_1296 [Pelomyxa schiedti]